MYINKCTTLRFVIAYVLLSFGIFCSENTNKKQTIKSYINLINKYIGELNKIEEEINKCNSDICGNKAVLEDLDGVDQGTLDTARKEKEKAEQNKKELENKYRTNEESKINNCRTIIAQEYKSGNITEKEFKMLIQLHTLSGLKDALQGIFDNTPTPTQPIAKYTNKKSGSIEIGLHLGYVYKFIGLELDAGIGFNFGSMTLQLNNTSAKINNVASMQVINNNSNSNINTFDGYMYGYMTPKLILQISRLVFKIGPRFKLGTIQKSKLLLFNISLQVDALVDINKYIAVGIKTVWLPMQKDVGLHGVNDEFKCGDLSVSLCVIGQYRHRNNIFYGSNLSCGWKMFKLEKNTI